MDLTDRLALRKPAGSDPFLRADFNYNQDRIDDYPGYFPCTSGTRPTWGAAQAGLLIFETDTGKILRWTGTVWETPNVFPKAVLFTANPGVSVAANTTYTQAMGNFTPPRPCSIWIQGYVNGGSAFENHDILVDAVSVRPGGTAARNAATVMGHATSVTAASHALSLSVTVDAGSVGPVTLNDIILILTYLD